MSNPEVTIRSRADISINNLVDEMDNGRSVMRSAHVGNLSAYNMALAAAGIPVLAVDHNITGVDKNYSPELIRANGEATQIAPTGRLTCRSATLSDGATLVDQHLNAVRRAIPDANIFTNTSYIQENSAIFQEIIGAALVVVPSAFERVAKAGGFTERSSRAIGLAQDGRILQMAGVDIDAEAAILPNVVDIVGNFVIEALRSGKQTMFHLSGPDMINYIGGLSAQINLLYSQILRTTALKDELPSTLLVELVPTANARFATTQDRAGALRHLMDTIEDSDEQVAQCAASRKIFFSTPESRDEAAKDTFIGLMKPVEAAAEAQVAEALSGIPEILANPGDSEQLSQYDVIAENGLFVAEQNTVLSMIEMQRLTKRLMRIRNRASP